MTRLLRTRVLSNLQNRLSTFRNKGFESYNTSSNLISCALQKKVANTTVIKCLKICLCMTRFYRWMFVLQCSWRRPFVHGFTGSLAAGHSHALTTPGHTSTQRQLKRWAMGVEETTFYYCSSSVLQRRRPRRQRPLQRLKPPPLASFLFTRLSPDYLSVICKKLLTDRGTGGQKQGIPFHFNFRVTAKNRISGGICIFWLVCLTKFLLCIQISILDQQGMK